MFLLRTNGLPYLASGRLVNIIGGPALVNQAGPLEPDVWGIEAGEADGEIRISIHDFGDPGDGTVADDGLGVITGHRWRVEGTTYADIPGADATGEFVVVAAVEHHGQTRNIQLQPLGYGGRPGVVVSSIITIPGVPLGEPRNLQRPVIAGDVFISAVSIGIWQGNPTPTFTYYWYRNDVLIPGADQPTLNTSGFTYADRFFLRVIASSTQGVAFADSNVLTRGLVNELIGADGANLQGVPPSSDNLVGT